MIQLNLLPDVKLEYIKAQRSRRLTISVAVLVTIASVVLLVGLFSVSLLQKKHLSDLSKDIASESSKLQKQPQIDKILTVQNQLQSLTALHDAKPAASRLFGYLNDLTPAQISITNFSTDFTQQTATITGTADALSSVNKYVDTLKFTTYTSSMVPTATKAFKGVVLSSFGLTAVHDVHDPNGAATFTINTAYDKNIFDTTQQVKLAIPSLTTTRSEIDKPSDLFKAAPATSNSTSCQPSPKGE